jgi:predicted RNA-binding Zn-ribbon protein involved in translation (DUF1610 family)
MTDPSLSLLSYIVYFLLVVLLLFLFFRELVCWYWKLNEIVLLLRSIDRKLPDAEAQPAPGTAAATETTAAPPAARFSCPKCFASIAADGPARTAPGRYRCPKCGQKIAIDQEAGAAAL